MEKPDSPALAEGRWFTAARASMEAAFASRKLAAVAEVGQAEAAVVRCVAKGEGVDVRPGSAVKRRREDERAALVKEGSDIVAVVADMIEAIINYESAEPFWISLDRWHYIAQEVRWTREMCASTDARYGIQRPCVSVEEAVAGYRQKMMDECEADAHTCEMNSRMISWRIETEETPAVLELARRLKACDDTLGDDDDDNPFPDLDDFPDDAAQDAAVAEWEAREEPKRKLIARADMILNERWLSRLPWKSALRWRLSDSGGWASHAPPCVMACIMRSGLCALQSS
eukprot:5503056-Prymnesium_polylepis.1